MVYRSLDKKEIGVLDSAQSPEGLFGILTASMFPATGANTGKCWSPTTATSF